MWNFDFKILIRIEDRVEGEKEKKGVALGQLLFGLLCFLLFDFYSSEQVFAQRNSLFMRAILLLLIDLGHSASHA